MTNLYNIKEESQATHLSQAQKIESQNITVFLFIGQERMLANIHAF